MIGRVTNQMVQRSSLANLQLNLSAMAGLQSKLSSGKVITKPSDDPYGTASALQLRSEKRAADQYSRNIDNGISWLGTIDTALQSSTEALRSARDLTVRGASSGNLSPVAREALATELEGIRDTLLSQADTQYLGRSVFAGTSNATTAFSGSTATPPYTSTATAGATVGRRIGSEMTVRVDADGAKAFGEGAWDAADPDACSVFGLIDQIAADLRSGVEVSSKLDNIDTRLNSMLGELADVGTRYGQLESAQQANAKTLTDLGGQISAVEDIDLAEVTVELKSQEVAYQAALGAISRVLQPSLLDFLR